jgi:hypothetical protein
VPNLPIPSRRQRWVSRRKHTDSGGIKTILVPIAGLKARIDIHFGVAFI